MRTNDDTLNGKPRYWQLAPDVALAEMPVNTNVRPPLLSDWESDRVRAFSNHDRRDRWMAGRTLAKAVLKEHMGLTGIIDIRDGSAGVPVVHRGGLPVDDVWLRIVNRDERIIVAVARRPIGLARRSIDAAESDVTKRFISRSDLRQLDHAFQYEGLSRAVAWAAKEAGQDAFPAQQVASLADVGIDDTMTLSLGNRHLSTLAVRVTAGSATVVVARPGPDDPVSPHFMGDDLVDHQVPRGSLRRTLERSMARARRMVDAKSRWRRPGWQGG